MNNAAQALHNAVRRYCYDQYRHWCDVYAATRHDDTAGGYRYSAKQKDIFPRYNMLKAIRIAVETIDPDQLDDFAATQRLLDALGESADDDFTRDPMDDVVRNAQDDERAKYSAFVASLNDQAVWDYDALPYQRVLTESEVNAVWETLREKWCIDRAEYWYPLSQTKQHVVAFDADAFHGAVPTEALIRELNATNVKRIFELREYGPNFVQETEAFEPVYTGAEGYWTSRVVDWVLYASHESTVTLAGSLMERVKKIWPRWAEHEIQPIM